MKFEIRQRDRRAILALVFGLAVYAAMKLAVFPAYDRFAIAADAVANKESQLRRYRRAELRKGQYAELIKLTSTKIAENESVVMNAANQSLISAELQSMVEASAAKLGLMLGQRSVGALRRLNDFYGELPMTLGFESTPGQLVMFLAELRSYPRLVTVRSIQVAPVRPVQEVPKGEDVTKNVRVTMTLAVLSRMETVRK